MKEKCPFYEHGLVRPLMKIGFPRVAIAIVLAITWTSNISHGVLDFSEGFCGQGEISQAMRARHYVGHHHDIKESERCTMQTSIVTHDSNYILHVSWALCLHVNYILEPATVSQVLQHFRSLWILARIPVHASSSVRAPALILYLGICFHHKRATFRVEPYMGEWLSQCVCALMCLCLFACFLFACLIL